MTIKSHLEIHQRRLANIIYMVPWIKVDQGARALTDRRDNNGKIQLRRTAVTICSPNDASRSGWPLLAIVGVIISFAIIGGNAWASEVASGESIEFPLSLESYGDENLDGIGARIQNRIQLEPFKLIASLILLCVIIHTFMASKLMSISNSRRYAQTNP